MKERPILFSGEMVRAILDGRKTQTRRVYGLHDDLFALGAQPEHYLSEMISRCKYGQPGDRLWVRETWVKWDGGLAYRADCLNKQGLEDEDSKRCRIDFGVKWRPSIFMPRWASRITLEVTGVRVERLQDITGGDAVAEGIDRQAAITKLRRMNGNYWEPETEGKFYRQEFADLWDSINAKRGYSWASNPWIWIVEFKRV